MRPFVAILIGIIVAFTLVSVGDVISHQIVPAPTDLDLQNRTALAEYAQSLPWTVFAVLYAAMLLGSFCGGSLACLISPSRAKVNAWVVGGLVLLGAIGNFVMIPHPPAFVGLTLVSLLTSPLAVSRLFRGVTPANSAA
ncbi:MAG: hypothetical protein KDC71_20420 [Acidobacteria bacterium]|nr:hypothetical protein [Acidobacteriota bacterium]